MARLKQTYQDTVAPAMKDKFGYGNIMEIPKVHKIVVNMGVGKAIESASHLDNAVKDLTTITGQKPQITRARKSISNFKLREGIPGSPGQRGVASYARFPRDLRETQRPGRLQPGLEGTIHLPRNRLR